jgi:cytochrome c oxidase subunit 3
VIEERKSFFKSIFEKPWEQAQALKDNDHDGKLLSISGSRLGLKTIMAVSCVIFSLFIVAYSDRMLAHDWMRMPEPWLLWVNTAILILNSFYFHKAKTASDKVNYTQIKKNLFIVGFLGYSFLISQIVVWYQLMQLNYYAGSNVANAFFYLLTTLHGVHLLGGLLFWGNTTSSLFKENYKFSKLQQRIELCAIYWHFLLAVWFVLFGLMLFT